MTNIFTLYALGLPFPPQNNSNRTEDPAISEVFPRQRQSDRPKQTSELPGQRIKPLGHVQKKLDVLCTSAVFVLPNISTANLRIDQCGHGDDVIALKVAAHDIIKAVLGSAAGYQGNQTTEEGHHWQR